ncbi:MAG TPA: prepilin-type N-terminal cleavage/methylation domain-containing protein [Thermoleophilia bacterium]|nr:prepilin-type N-terminal cleavage/methylation domain-containing protein [Thermoleophilia bacterium]
MRHAEGVTTRARTPGQASAGFSLIELLVTVTLAGIIFLAMTPFFVSVLKTTSSNERRVIATNLAQARVERVRMLAFADITQNNLNSSTFAAGQFNPSFTAVHGGAPYTITTTVTTPTPTASPAYKTVVVSVSRPGDNFTTTAKTVVMNPAAITATSTSGGSGGTGPYSITVAFKSSAEVTSKGCVLIQYAMNQSATPTPIPTATVTISPTLHPAASPTNSTVQWTGLTGGMGYLYTVTTYCTSSATPTETCQPFNLLSNWWMKFDTNPGGS